MTMLTNLQLNMSQPLHRSSSFVNIDTGMFHRPTSLAHCSRLKVGSMTLALDDVWSFGPTMRERTWQTSHLSQRSRLLHKNGNMSTLYGEFSNAIYFVPHSFRRLILLLSLSSPMNWILFTIRLGSWMYLGCTAALLLSITASSQWWTMICHHLLISPSWEAMRSQSWLPAKKYWISYGQKIWAKQARSKVWVAKTAIVTASWHN